MDAHAFCIESRNVIELSLNNFQPMVGNGDVFNEDNERIIDGTVNTDYSDATKITSTLTIEKVSVRNFVNRIALFTNFVPPF